MSNYEVASRDSEIRGLAYQIWESEGKPHGQADRHWKMAEKLCGTAPEPSSLKSVNTSEYETSNNSFLKSINPETLEIEAKESELMIDKLSKTFVPSTEAYNSDAMVEDNNESTGDRLSVTAGKNSVQDSEKSARTGSRTGKQEKITKISKASKTNQKIANEIE